MSYVNSLITLWAALGKSRKPPLSECQSDRKLKVIYCVRGVIEPLLAKWLEHPFFRRRPPKSTGRELFGEAFLTPVMAEMKRRSLSKYDIIATLTEFTARSIVLNYRLHLLNIPHEVILTGGGAANAVLANAINRELSKLRPDIRVATSADHGWPLQTVEAGAFGLLACLRFHDQPGNIPATTGARQAAVLGQISLP